MHLLALAFNAKKTLRMEELAGALIAIGGALLCLGALTPFMRRPGQIFGGLGVAAGGVLFVLAVRYGLHP